MNSYPFSHYQNFFSIQLSHQNQRLYKQIKAHKEKITHLESEIHRLTIENKMLRELLEREQYPLEVENLYLSFDTYLDELRINSLQSGSALNIGKLISNTTNSDMEMEMGDNSMNSGDSNQMEHINHEKELIDK